MGINGLIHKYLVLCEGIHDAEFLRHLGKTRGLPDFQCEPCGNISGDQSNGISHLTRALNALPALDGFSSLKTITIMADNDANPSGSFSEVCRLINGTDAFGQGRRYTAPADPLVKAGTNPAIIVMMVPWRNVPGALDCLCLTAAASAFPATASCVETFSQCAGVEGWGSRTKISKMKLHSLIAATHEKNPGLSPAWVWSEQTNIVPLDNSVFDQIATFLRSDALV